MRCAYLALGLLLAPALLSHAHAHTTVEVGGYSIEVGWGIEPPVVGYRNAVVFDMAELGGSEGVSTGVKNAFKNLDAAVRFGGASKPLNISADPRPGHYFSDIIPTKTGSYSVRLDGEIDGTAVSVDIPIEDAESTAILDFPPKAPGGAEDLGPVRQALSSLQRDVSDLRAGGAGAPGDARGAAYDVAVFGASLGAAGVILAVVAMIKRK